MRLAHWCCVAMVLASSSLSRGTLSPTRAALAVVGQAPRLSEEFPREPLAKTLFSKPGKLFFLQRAGVVTVFFTLRSSFAWCR